MDDFTQVTFGQIQEILSRMTPEEMVRAERILMEDPRRRVSIENGEFVVRFEIQMLLDILKDFKE